MEQPLHLYPNSEVLEFSLIIKLNLVNLVSKVNIKKGLHQNSLAEVKSYLKILEYDTIQGTYHVVVRLLETFLPHDRLPKQWY